MYYYFDGTVTDKGEKSIVIECHGVGYELLVSDNSKYNIGQHYRIYSAFFIREDEQYLIGFDSSEQKKFFNMLISVKSVGPKSAITILGSAPLERIIKAINDEDLGFLKSIPGIGPKTASQIILDLKGKLKISQTSTSTGNTYKDDAISALKSLGYKVSEIEKVIYSVPNNLTSTEEYVSLLLRKLNVYSK